MDCVGFEARGHGQEATVERPATVLNALMTVTRAGGALGIPGLYVTDDPGGVDDNAKTGMLGIRIGLGWAKSHCFTTGQCPVMRYNRQLMQAILYDKIQIAKAVNATVISLDECARRIQGLRPRCGQEVRDRSAQDGRVIRCVAWRRHSCLPRPDSSGRFGSGSQLTRQRSRRVHRPFGMPDGIAV